MKILTIVGARPQFVKAAAVSRVLRQQAGVQEILVHTGQHFDANMSEVFFQEMKIPQPDYNLEIAGLNHGAMTGRMLEKVEEVLLREKPDRVLVYGDTNSTLAGGLAAAKLHIPVAHVEAGLRSHNMRMPEEVNRIITDRLSDILFCPTDTAVHNLENEGFSSFKECRVVRCGDVMMDAAYYYAPRSRKPEGLSGLDPDKEFGLITLHRAENTDDEKRLKDIIESIESLSRELPLVFPVHPRTTAKLAKAGLSLGENNSDRIFRIDPVGYLEMLFLLTRCQMVLTDSGGLQKEAFFFQKPCVTMRDETEWVELVDHGYNVIVGSDPEKFRQGVQTMLHTEVGKEDLYGNGQASETIVQQLLG